MLLEAVVLGRGSELAQKLVVPYWSEAPIRNEAELSRICGSATLSHFRQGLRGDYGRSGLLT